MSQTELAAALADWFAAHKDDRHLYRSPVWAVLKAGMRARGSYKERPRGAGGAAGRPNAPVGARRG